MNILAAWWQIAGLGRHPRTHLFWKRVAKTRNPERCWEWQGGRTACGYGHLRWHGALVYAHRLAYEFSRGRIPHGMVVMHLCDNPACCRPTHLRLGTQSENMRDMAARGRSRNKLLSVDQVLNIRSRYAAGENGAQLASAFGVTPTAIGYIVRHQTYRHLEAA